MSSNGDFDYVTEYNGVLPGASDWSKYTADMLIERLSRAMPDPMPDDLRRSMDIMLLHMRHLFPETEATTPEQRRFLAAGVSVLMTWFSYWHLAFRNHLRTEDAEVCDAVHATIDSLTSWMTNAAVRVVSFLNADEIHESTVPLSSMPPFPDA